MNITRRDLLKSLAASPVLLQPQQPPPNILFILSDDHSAPYLGAYGATWMSTPNLDKCAREGVLFERAFTAAPQCVPSRTALMTGRSPVAALAWAASALRFRRIQSPPLKRCARRDTSGTWLVRPLVRSQPACRLLISYASASL